ncbi:MAG: ShlB/FhaC/HecB family hemolysin secretion/activation protein [Gemmatimonadaceae bacterium]
MHLALALLVIAQQGSITLGAGRAKSDSARRAARDSVRAERIVERELRSHRRDREPRRIAVTAELEESAFKDAGARELLLRARVSRLRQDSALLSYDATAHQRISVGLGIRAVGRERLLWRSETATRVRWSRSSGVWVDLKGQRMAFPSGSGSGLRAEVSMEEAAPIPYFPGRDALWIGAANGLARAEVDDRELVHPLALGSEAYYRYATGDSLTLTLPDAKEIRLRELRVEPRRPEWKLSVGSFWFDAVSGQLVRAAYRLAVPIDIWTVSREEARREGERDPDDEVPVWIKPIMSPMRASLEAVTIEYGLFGGNFWLPRTQSAEAFAQVSFMRVPVRIEERFKYLDVNGADTLAALPAPLPSLAESLFPNDSVPWRDLSADERSRRHAVLAEAARERARERDSVRARECRAGGTYTRVERRHGRALTVATRVPCDSLVLLRAPELVGSIYDDGEELFGVREREELKKSLGFGLQSAWAPQPPVWRYGAALTRYNRVEGLSTALGLSQELGRGFSASTELRFGLSDRKVNGELALQRSNGRATWRVGGYNRLVGANDWGSPLSFGNSLGALLFGVDDGVYYRAGGAELVAAPANGAEWQTRLFVERHRAASRTTHASLAHALNDVRFLENIAADTGDIAGFAARIVRSYGLDPLAWRAHVDVRAEMGVGDFNFQRVAADLTSGRAIGPVAVSLTAGAGAAFGAVPVQRRFFLGGTHTVRGQRIDLTGGESYWLARAELGLANVAFRPVVFADLGWAGPREDFRHPGRPLSGAGAGVSVLDGLIRLDLARGLYPSEKFRFYGYLEARF